jgi:hypothetical protein
MILPQYVSKHKNLIHEFDVNLTSNHDLLLLARTAAAKMDHECTSDTPVNAHWRSPSEVERNLLKVGADSTIVLELQDPKLGIEKITFFSKKDLLGVYGPYELLHNWNQFVQMQLRELIKTTFGDSDDVIEE